jgi:hypothetical protein
VSGLGWSPKLKDLGCDNVLPAQGYCTPLRAVADEYKATIKLWLEQDSQSSSEENLLQ